MGLFSKKTKEETVAPTQTTIAQEPVAAPDFSSQLGTTTEPGPNQITEVIQSAPEVAVPQTPAPAPQQEVTVPTPEIAQPTPEAAQATPEAAQPTPEIAQPTPEVAQPTPEVAQPTPEVAQPTPEVAQPAVQEPSATPVPMPEVAPAPVIENQPTQSAQQPVAETTELVPESPSMGLLENDPFTENPGPTDSQIEDSTGAQVEGPNPILEQQIALDVNIEEVIENGTTKEDEITKIVADNVNAAAVAQAMNEQAAAQSSQPPTQPQTQTTEVAQPTPDTTQPAPEVAQPAVQEPIATTVPMPEVASPSSAQEPVVELTPTPPQADGLQGVESGQTLTLEPGPITDTASSETPTGLPVAEPVQSLTLEPGAIENSAQSNPFNGVEAPTVKEEEVVAPTMDIAEQNLQSIEPTSIEQQPMMTLEPGPIIAPEIQNNNLVEEGMQPDFQTGNPEQEVNLNINIENQQPAPAQETTIENAVENNVEAPTVEETNMVEAPSPAQEVSLVPKPVVNPVENVVEEQTLTAPTEAETKKVIMQSAPLGRIQPVAPIAVYSEESEEPEDSYAPPVATTDIKDDISVEVTSLEEPAPAAEPVPKVEEQQVIEEKEEVKEPTPSVEEPAINNEEATPQEEVTPETTKENPEPSIAVEQELFTTVENNEPKMSRNSKRKILRGKEKFTPPKEEPKEEIITEPVKERKGLLFCDSCGNLLSSVDVICPICGDPVK